MSLYTYTNKLLGVYPRMRRTPCGLIARTPIVLELLTLFSYGRRLEVSTRERVIRIRTRIAWFFGRERQIPFGAVERLEYSFGAVGTEWGYTGRTDQLEMFSIAAVLKDGEEVRLLSFVGDGSVATGWGGVLVGGDTVVDAEGAQQEESLDAVEVLAEMIGVRVGKPGYRPEPGATWSCACPRCGRHNPKSRASCQYCGADLATSTAAPPGADAEAR